MRFSGRKRRDSEERMRSGREGSDDGWQRRSKGREMMRSVNVENLMMSVEERNLQNGGERSDLRSSGRRKRIGGCLKRS